MGEAAVIARGASVGRVCRVGRVQLRYRRASEGRRARTIGGLPVDLAFAFRARMGFFWCDFLPAGRGVVGISFYMCRVVMDRRVT